MSEPDDSRRGPDMTAAMDRRRPLSERRAAYQRWAEEHQLHHHPHLSIRHAHDGGLPGRSHDLEHR